MMRLVATLLVFISLSTGLAVAGETTTYPDIPKAVGAPHPEGNAYMRINHMRLMRHDRDLTMREGDRSIKYSIKECVACHAVMGPEAMPISVQEEGHFCRACHEYAAVKIDCFQCHNSKPEEGFIDLLKQTPAATDDEIQAYLDGMSQ